MIISFCGDNGSGKSTAAIKIAKKLGFKHYHMGQVLRDMAKEKNITLEELNDLREKDSNFDKSVDDFLIKLGKDSDNFVIESRTAWFFIPNSLKIYLKVEEQEAAKRIFLELQGQNKRNEGKNLDSKKKVLESIRKRRNKDNGIYQKLYGINIRDEKHYDFVLDTTDLSIKKVFEEIMEFINSKINKQK